MNNNKKSYDYGKCHVCGEQMEEQRIQQNLSERIAFLFAPEKRIEIKRSVIRAYGL
jgi:hypothetical protein